MNHERNVSGDGLRSLLSTQVSGEETMTHRDVIDDAMAWGDQRRRRDRVLAVTGAALAVAMVGAGAVSLGSSGISNTPAANGPATPGAPNGTAPCGVPEIGLPVNDSQLCQLEAQLRQVGSHFANAAVPFVNKHLPAGVTAAAQAPDTLNIILTGSQGTNGAMINLEPNPAGYQQPCGPAWAGYDCKISTVSGGRVLAQTIKQQQSVTSSVRWNAAADYSIMIQSWNKPVVTPTNVYGPPGDAPTGTPNTHSGSHTAFTPPPSQPPAGGTYSTPPPNLVPAPPPTQRPEATTTAAYLTTDTMTAIIQDPGFQALAVKDFASYSALHSQILTLEAKLGYGPTSTTTASATRS